MGWKHVAYSAAVLALASWLLIDAITNKNVVAVYFFSVLWLATLILWTWAMHAFVKKRNYDQEMKT